MRSFRDSANVSWTVFEVRRQVTSRGDGSYLPGNYSDGWLCFESVGAKRRLVKYPRHWRELTDAELEGLLSVAQPAPRTTFRGSDDLGDPSPLRDA
jgi:hypothetical protein